MKKFILFLAVAGLISCNCISQVPTQTIYAGQSCTAPLPDYTQIVSVDDNCAVKSFTQTPSPGTMLTTTNPQVTVLLRAEDNQGNVSTRNFNVVLLDTIPPVFNFPAEMLSYTPETFNYVYLDIIEPMVKEMIMDWACNFRWDLIPIPNGQDTVKVWQHVVQPTEAEFQAYKNR
jgi:hypothetical protein